MLTGDAGENNDYGNRYVIFCYILWATQLGLFGPSSDFINSLDIAYLKDLCPP
jgi:hypothetical protein